MSHLAEVVTLFDKNASDVPAMLRQSADSIESETDEYDRTKAMVGVQVTEGGNIEIYGWGAIDTVQTIAFLHMAAAKLIAMQLDQ